MVLTEQTHSGLSTGRKSAKQVHLTTGGWRGAMEPPVVVVVVVAAVVVVVALNHVSDQVATDR